MTTRDPRHPEFDMDGAIETLRADADAEVREAALAAYEGESWAVTACMRVLRERFAWAEA